MPPRIIFQTTWGFTPRNGHDAIVVLQAQTPSKRGPALAIHLVKYDLHGHKWHAGHAPCFRRLNANSPAQAKTQFRFDVRMAHFFVNFELDVHVSEGVGPHFVIS